MSATCCHRAVFDIMSELIDNGHCFSQTGLNFGNLDFRPCPGDGVLIGFQHDFQLKVHVGLGELFLSFGGFLFALPEVYETWQVKKELNADNLEKTMKRLISVSAMLQMVPKIASIA